MPSDPLVFDELKLPSIFVPHGEPEPTEWLERHPDHIKLPATFVPRADSDDRTSLSSASPPPGQRRAADGLAAPSDPAAPWPLAGNAMSDAMSAGTNGASGGASIPDDPITAFRRASDALATAASDHVLGGAAGLDLYANVGNGPPNRTAPSGPPVEQVGSAIWSSIMPSAHAQAVEPDAENRGLLEEIVDPLAELRIKAYSAARARLRAVDPDNLELQGLTATNSRWVPSQANIDAVNQAYIDAQTRIADQAYSGKAGRRENHRNSSVAPALDQRATSRHPTTN
jgi:hypothetical protein